MVTPRIGAIGQVRLQRIVQAQPSLVAQAHDQDGHEGLGQ